MGNRKVSNMYKNKRNEMKDVNRHLKEKVDYIDRRIINAFTIGVFDLEGMDEEDVLNRLYYLPGIYLKFMDILLLMLHNCNHFRKGKVDGIAFYRDLWYGYVDKRGRNRRVNKITNRQFDLVKNEMRYLLKGYLDNHYAIDMESLKVHITRLFDFICTQEKIRMNNSGVSNNWFYRIRYEIRKKRYRNIIKSKKSYE